MRCKDCSEVRGYPYKRSHLVALRRTKISASDPPSYWWRANDKKKTPKRGRADYQACREQRDWTAWKCRMPLPTQRQDGIARCLCGETITIACIDAHRAMRA